jgi:16S rRNA (uracil1498-N3)-methyltransferase
VTHSTAGEPRESEHGLKPPFFVAGTAALQGERVVLRGQEGRHAASVRRLAIGEQAYLTDGAGTVAQCVVTGLGSGELELSVCGVTSEPRSEPSVTVVQAIPKGDRGELAVELLTEVGVDVIVPWAAERCVAQWRGERAAKSLARWQSTAVQAAKQSRRAWFPQVLPQAGLAAVVDRVRAAAAAVLLDADATARLADLELPAAGEIVLIVGPEGGIAPAEQDALAAAGATSARLGPTVLRASSAGVVAAGVALARTGRW